MKLIIKNEDMDPRLREDEEWGEFKLVRYRVNVSGKMSRWDTLCVCSLKF